MNVRVETVVRNEKTPSEGVIPIRKKIQHFRDIDFVDTEGPVIRLHRESRISSDELDLVARFATSEIASLEITD